MIFLKNFIVLMVLLVSISVVEALDKSRVEIGANKINELGITGKGITICLIDDGVDYTNEYLGGCTTPQYQAGNCPTIIAGRNIMDGDTDILPKTNQDHGTHIAGILISSHQNYEGISPEAKLAVVKVYSDIDDTSSCQGFIDAINWCIINSNQYNISVISLSYGLNVCEASYTSQFQNSINNATANGISFIKSSGNSLTSSSSIMTFPAQLGNVTTVGSTTGDSVSNFTRRLPTSKLDLLAPGHKIRSTNNGGGLSPFLKNILCSTDPPFVPGSFLYNLTICNSGTSYATPHVSASVALLREYDPALKPFDIEQMLREDGDRIYDSVTNTDLTKINLLKALHILDWPTFHHDNRRTGFTLLKGDMSKESQVEKINLILHADVTSDSVARPSIADIDGNGNMETVVATARNQNEGYIYAIETKKTMLTPITKKLKTELRWSKNIGKNILVTPTLSNIDSDSQKEVVFGLDNGTLYAIDVSSSGDSASVKWTYTVSEKGGYIGELGNTAVADIDNDGINEIIVMDGMPGLPSWAGELYVLRDNGNSATLEDKYNISNGGGWGAVSLANVDSDDYEEIIVPSYYGVYVFDYNGFALTEKCSTTDGKLFNSVVVYDTDKDNKYELIYTTTTNGCSAPKTCYNKLYVLDAETCNDESGWPKTIGYYSRTTPAIANLDSDANLEIVISARDSTEGYDSRILCYDANTGNEDCNYNNGGYLDAYEISPDIFDVDGDGDYNIIIPDKNYELHILDDSGIQLYTVTLDGVIGSAPAVGDLDNDGVAEIAVKRAGSPINVLTTMSNFNDKPELAEISNITIIAGEFRNINETGEIIATDEDNDALTYYFSSPFNESGFWQSTINDTGNYTILVEASDGNLSDTKLANLIVFNYTTRRNQKFDDNTKVKSLDYSSPQNQSVHIRMRKNSTIEYARIKIAGGN